MTFKLNLIKLISKSKLHKLLLMAEAATERCSVKKVFRIYAANLKQNNHAEV